METQVTFQAILSHLGYELIKQQDALERAINSNSDIETKVVSISNALREMIIVESMISKFQSMINTTPAAIPETPKQ